MYLTEAAASTSKAWPFADSGIRLAPKSSRMTTRMRMTFVPPRHPIKASVLVISRSLCLDVMHYERGKGSKDSVTAILYPKQRHGGYFLSSQRHKISFCLSINEHSLSVYVPTPYIMMLFLNIQMHKRR